MRDFTIFLLKDRALNVASVSHACSRNRDWSTRGASIELRLFRTCLRKLTQSFTPEHHAGIPSG